ncbi:unnamed protein product [Meganyctiphanes norvegica]|uniref:peptidylprolyl isomerase n=1 Tax=Meganyctiphanes norvegica TaxID=48144 RepID=A0AAV2RYD8_MEGNR
MVNFSTAILLATITVCSAGQLLIENLNDPANCRRPSKDGDTLKTHYTGTLASDGTQFDSSIGMHYTGTLTSDGTQFASIIGRGPFEFELGAGRVIKGWDQGLSGMCPGDKRKLTIPPELGYGDRGAGPIIKGGATLVFEVQLVGIEGVEEESNLPGEPRLDNKHQSGGHSSDDSDDDDDDDDENSAGKHFLQISFLIFNILKSLFI